jgi:hypothetical protein
MQREIEFKLKVKLVIPEQALKFTKKILDMIQSWSREGELQDGGRKISDGVTKWSCVWRKRQNEEESA